MTTASITSAELAQLMDELNRLRRLHQPTTRLPVVAGFETLANVLDEALLQAQGGKGIDRHSSAGEAFVDQQIVQLGEWMGGSTAFAIGQACKKALESTRLPDDRARRELLGTIVYAAAAVLVIDRRTKRGESNG